MCPLKPSTLSSLGDDLARFPRPEVLGFGYISGHGVVNHVQYDVALAGVLGQFYSGVSVETDTIELWRQRCVVLLDLTRLPLGERLHKRPGVFPNGD